MNVAATPASGPAMITRSVKIVPSGTGSIWCSKRMDSPGNDDVPVQSLGDSTWVTVEAVAGPPLPFTVIRAPTPNSRSIEADSMMPPGHRGGSVHTSHTCGADAELLVDPSKDRRALAMC